MSEPHAVWLTVSNSQLVHKAGCALFTESAAPEPELTGYLILFYHPPKSLGLLTLYSGGIPTKFPGDLFLLSRLLFEF